MRRAAAVLALALVAAGCSEHTPRPVAKTSLPGPDLSSAWSPRANEFAVGALGRVVLLSSRGRRIRTLDVGSDEVWGLAWSPTRDELAAAAGDGRVHVWTAAGRQLAALTAHHGIAYSVAWSPGGRSLVAGYEDGFVVRWDVGRRRVVGVWGGHKAEVLAVAWSPDGTRIASGSVDQTVRVRNARTGRLIAVLEDPLLRDKPPDVNIDVNGLAWSPDGELLAAAGQDGIVRLWDLQTDHIRTRLKGGDGWARGLAWTPNGKVLAASGKDGSIRLFDRKRRRANRVLYIDTTPVWSVGWSRDGHFMAGVTDAGTVRIWAFG